MVKEMYMSRNKFIQDFGMIPSESSQGVEITDPKNDKRLILFTDTDGKRWAIRELNKLIKLEDPRKERVNK